MIQLIEELSINALPSLQTLLVDGWVLRFANGCTKRANSINPMYACAGNGEERIQFCEETYQRNNLPVVFKMTLAVYPENLDEMLARRGYEVDSPTSVQAMDLSDTYSPLNVALDATLTEEWLADFCRMGGMSDERKPTLRQMLTNIIPQKCFATICPDSQAIACGLSVLQGKYIGCYDVITDASFRNQEYGKRLMCSLLAWGKQNGARKAYLQVMLTNAPALHLYAQLGFKEVYQYWYRIKR
jgi:ribosomal protein S18 acetylase RimI-like enzyme